MTTRALSDEDRRRLAEERAAADRAYNDALTEVDRASQAPPQRIPDPPPPLDDQLIAPINDRWRIAIAPPAASGWRRRAAGFVWRLVGPLFDRQQQFNAAVVEHLNRNVEGERRTREAQAETLAFLRGHAERLAAFESRLVQFLQQITAYVDTKDRDATALALQAPHEQARALEQTIALVQQQVSALKREVERTVGGPERAAPPDSSAAPSGGAISGGHSDSHSGSAALSGPRSSDLDAISGGPSGSAALSGPRSSDLDAYKYVAFQHEFRGDEPAIRERLESYAALFSGASDVLDVGCGRGEFLKALQGRGVTGRGVELNHEMVELCRSQGLNVDEGDAVTFLDALPDGAIGGLFAAQVVEHLEPAYLMRFLELAYHKLRPDSRIVLETINVDCWSAFFGPYLRDITHVRPLPADTLGYLLRASGFQRVEIRAASPVDESARLRRVPVDAATDPAVRALAESVNRTVDTLNGLLFTHMDYAAVAERL